jgi:putative RNA 2'-phosphotransferase
LIIQVNKKGITLDKAILKHIVETNPKKRFAFNETLDKIRASQGHSVEIDLDYSPQKPPEILYHGTSMAKVQSILTTGIQKQNRHHVHLSKDIETAIVVGTRHGKPFVFEVLAEKMYQDNHLFYLSENGVWLTDHVSPQYLKEYQNVTT